MKVLFIGDIVGKSGRNALFEHLPFLKEKYDYDMLIVNGENSAHGKGITRKIYDSLIDAGVNCVTLGNHAFSKDNIYTFIDDAEYLIRPYNMEPMNVGNACKIFFYGDKKVGVYNIYGTVFMDKSTMSPFEAMDLLLQKYRCDIKIVDFHGEATSEKYAFMNYFKDQVQMIVGTHTHVQTADEAIYGNCAFICDAGMCGPVDSIIGRDSEEVLDRLVNGTNTRYTVSDNPGMVCGVIVEIDENAGKAVSIERIRILPEY